jgi:hypothetical protein
MYIVTVELTQVIICFENAEDDNVNTVSVELTEKKREK